MRPCLNPFHPLSMAVVVLAVLMPGPLLAAPGPVEITPMVGYRTSGSFKDPRTDATLDLDENTSFGLVLNMDYDRNTQWEFTLSRQTTSLQTGTVFSGDPRFDLDVTYATAGGIYIWRDPSVEPFIGASLGISHMAPDDGRFDSETRVLLSLVGGYKFRLSDRIGLRIEVRGYETLMSSDTGIFCGNGGCAARVDGQGFGQLEFNAGLTLRF